MSVLHRINGRRVNRYRRRRYYLAFAAFDTVNRCTVNDCVPIELSGLKTTRAALRSIVRAELLARGVTRILNGYAILVCQRGAELWQGPIFARKQSAPRVAA